MGKKLVILVPRVRIQLVHLNARAMMVMLEMGKPVQVKKLLSVLRLRSHIQCMIDAKLL